jgi:hypothetical protein
MKELRPGIPEAQELRYAVKQSIIKEIIAELKKHSNPIISAEEIEVNNNDFNAVMAKKHKEARDAMDSICVRLENLIRGI